MHPERDLMPTPTTIKLGLRFYHKDAPRLRQLADRVQQADLTGEALSTFQLAADAAEQNEPLIVVCRQAEEATQMAQGYTQFGITEPNVVQLHAA